jgi:hypothetical protein
MSVRQRMRFRDYHVRTDQAATPVRTVVCVTDEEHCRWTSGERTHADDVTALIAKHAAETGHHCYRRTVTDYATAEPGDFH